MAKEFAHIETAGARTEDQYEGVSEHLIAAQATGDLLYADDATHIRGLAIATTEGYVLTVASTSKPAWKASSANVSTSALWAAKGDLAGGTGAATAAALTVGADHTKLVANAAETTGLKWVADVAAINYVIDGGTTAITTGIKGDLEVPFAGTVQAWTVLAYPTSATNALVIDVWKDTYANFPPTDADAMPGAGHEPTITTGAIKGQDTDASDWATVNIAAGDVLRFNVDSCTDITRATLSLKIKRTY